MVYEGSFFFIKGILYSLIFICISDLKDQKLPVSAKRPELAITDQKFYLPSGLKIGEGSLPVAITAQIGEIGTSANVKPWFL